MKLVVDTNTLISGSLWHGPSAQILEGAAQGKVEIVTSAELLAEFANVIARPKFAERLTTQSTTPTDLARKLADEVTIILPVSLPLPAELRDAKDLPVLACACSPIPLQSFPATRTC